MCTLTVTSPNVTSEDQFSLPFWGYHNCTSRAFKILHTKAACLTDCLTVCLSYIKNGERMSHNYNLCKRPIWQLVTLWLSNVTCGLWFTCGTVQCSTDLWYFMGFALTWVLLWHSTVCNHTIVFYGIQLCCIPQWHIKVPYWPEVFYGITPLSVLWLSRVHKCPVAQ